MLKDADIREPLFDFLEETFGKVRILEEKTTGLSRADVVMITEDAITGIEIKSDADSYQRLSRQIKDYDKFYDYNYVAVGTKHALHIKEHVPEHWGIITVEKVDDVVDFYILRRPLPNPFMKLSNQLGLLWRPELAILQNKYNMPKYKDRSASFVIDKIINRIELPEDNPKKINRERLKAEICGLLFERDYSNVSKTLEEYRKSEMVKQIEAEADNTRRIELIMELSEKRYNFRRNVNKKRAGRRLRKR